MDASGRFLVDLTVGIVGAGAGGYLARLARLTPVLGYLVAGVVIGPFTPGVTADARGAALEYRDRRRPSRRPRPTGAILGTVGGRVVDRSGALRRRVAGARGNAARRLAVIGPFRELFVMLFFVALGMALDVRAVLAAWPAVLAFGAILIGVRFRAPFTALPMPTCC